MTDIEQQQTQTLDPLTLYKLLDNVIPPLSHSYHKGQAGRIGVIGGSRDFTGAPYFAAISALRVGADLAYVFCSKDAAPAIKSYSPELIVIPVLDNDDRGLTEIKNFLPKLHCLVIGPGLGHDRSVLAMVADLIPHLKGIPVIIDADALTVINNMPSIVKGFANLVLTPNKMEFARLLRALDSDPVRCDDGNLNDVVHSCARSLDGPTLFVKGRKDVITNGNVIVSCEEENSARRCGGQGDVLAGSISAFSCWTHSSNKLPKSVPSTTLACFAASMLTRRCNKLAFSTCGRGMLASDMIKQINSSFKQLFPID